MTVQVEFDGLISEYLRRGRKGQTMPVGQKGTKSMPKQLENDGWGLDEHQGGASNFLRVKDGDKPAVFRIIGPIPGDEFDSKGKPTAKPFTFWEWWAETSEGRRPKRVKGKEDVPRSQWKELDKFGNPSPKLQWGFVVYNGALDKIQFWQTDKPGVAGDLRAYQEGEWGALTGYDVKLFKESKGAKSKWRITPCPPSAIDKAIIKTAVAANLEAVLEENGNPFEGMETSFDSAELEDGDEEETGLAAVISEKQRRALKALHLPDAEEKRILAAYKYESTTAISEPDYAEILADFTAAAAKLAAKPAKPIRRS